MEDDRRIEIEALEARIAKLQYRLFELRREAPPEVLMPFHAREYRIAAEFGWRREEAGVAIIGSCRGENGDTGSYRFMIDRHALAEVRNRDVFAFWERVLKRTISHLAHEMYDPEQDAKERAATPAPALSAALVRAARPEPR